MAIKVQQNNSIESESLRIFREGWALPSPFGFGQYVNPDPIVGGQQVNIIDVGTGFNGALCICDGISISVNQNIYLQLVSNTYPSGDATIMTENPGFDYRNFFWANTTTIIPGNFVFEGQKQLRVNILEETVGGNINIPAGLKVSANLINPRRMSLSQRNSAGKVIYWIGDSITGLTSVGTRKFLADDFHIYKVENFINTNISAKGIFARTVNKAIGSQTASDFVKYIKNRVSDIDQADVIIVAYGTNEALGSTTVNDYVSDMTYIWNWKKLRYPNSHMLFIGPTPLGTNLDTENTKLISLRAAILAFVNTTNDAKLSYVSLENAFDRTVLTNYTSSDGVHPGTQACFDSMSSIINTHINSNINIKTILGF